MKDIKLTASILKEGEKAFTAWIQEIRGVVAQGESIEEVQEELFKMLRIKFEIERNEISSSNDGDLITTQEYSLSQI